MQLIFFLKCLVGFTWEVIWSWTLVYLDFFLIIDSILFLFGFSVSFWFSFRRLCISRNGSISSRQSNLWEYKLLYQSFIILCFSAVRGDLFFFVSDFIWTLFPHPSPLFLWVWLKVVTNFYLFNEASLNFIALFYYSSSLYLTHFHFELWT